MPKKTNNLPARIRALENLLSLLSPVPEEWADVVLPDNLSPELKPVACDSWKALTAAWQEAMRWRNDLDEVLSILLGVAISTNQIGDQLFLMLVSDAGGGKTRLCEAMLVSRNCHALEHVKGFHSGFRDGTGDDFSLIARINHKTLITPEGDVLIADPNAPVIMSQQRRIFDGTTGASYKNRKEDLRYTGLRTPWIIAGTPALLELDQARLGDRFLRVFLSQPDEDEKDMILDHVAETALRSVRASVDGSPESQMDPAMCRAYQLTGGYVDWLREEGVDRLKDVHFPPENLWRCKRLAGLTAAMRARPNPDPRNKEPYATTELPTRINHQLVRLACCLAVVLGRESVDTDVMRRVARVAADTARGQTLDICRCLAGNPEGLEARSVALMSGHPDGRTRDLLRFLAQTEVTEQHTALRRAANGKIVRSTPRWRLTARMKTLWQEVFDG